jgi:hypothetical protein
MKKTIQDLSKIGSTTVNIAKKIAYYGYIPLIIVLGLRTIDFNAMMAQPPM